MSSQLRLHRSFLWTSGICKTVVERLSISWLFMLSCACSIQQVTVPNWENSGRVKVSMHGLIGQQTGSKTYKPQELELLKSSELNFDVSAFFLLNLEVCRQTYLRFALNCFLFGSLNAHFIQNIQSITLFVLLFSFLFKSFVYFLPVIASGAGGRERRCAPLGDIVAKALTAAVRICRRNSKRCQRHRSGSDAAVGRKQSASQQERKAHFRLGAFFSFAGSACLRKDTVRALYLVSLYKF